MTETSAGAGFRILELVSLLLPIVLIVLQVTMRYYRNDETGTPVLRQSIILLSIAAVAIVTIFAGVTSVSYLIEQGYDDSITLSLVLLRAALYLMAVPVVVFVFMALAEVRSDMIHPDVLNLTRERAFGGGEESNDASENIKPDDHEGKNE